MLFEVQDPLGRTVSLRETTWESHVAKRPELKNQLSFVEETVRDPDLVIEAADGSHRYYAAGISPRFPNLYLHVLVRLESSDRGYVRSAWFSAAVEEGVFEWIRPILRPFAGS
jgi:hypothetical protein